MTENFEVGDKVRRTRDHAMGTAKKGYVFRVAFLTPFSARDKGGVIHRLDALEKVEKKPRKIRVGDRVRVVNPAALPKVGYEFTVRGVRWSPGALHLGGYYVTGEGATGGVWANHVERIKPEPKPRKPKLGETWVITQDTYRYKDVEAKVIEQGGNLRFEFPSAYGYSEPDHVDVDAALANGWTGKRIAKAPKSHKPERTDEIQSLIIEASRPHQDYTYRDLTDLIKELGEALEAATR